MDCCGCFAAPPEKTRVGVEVNKTVVGVLNYYEYVSLCVEVFYIGDSPSPCMNE